MPVERGDPLSLKLFTARCEMAFRKITWAEELESVLMVNGSITYASWIM